MSLHIVTAAKDRPGLGRREIVVLGILSAIGPVGVDIYLPAFPTIARDLGTDIGSVQLSMAAYFLALALGQLPYGAVSDRVGRKPPVLFGLVVFIAGSLVCALAGNAQALIAGRFVQGLGICSVLSIARAIVRDRQQGQDAAHTAARILLIVSVSPMLAPLAGSAIVGMGTWRHIFWLMAALTTVVLFLAWKVLPETSETRHDATVAALASKCLRLLRDTQFLLPTAVLAAAQAGASIYLAGSSAVYLESYGLAPAAYSIAFAINAIGMIFAAQWNRRLIGKLGLATVPILGTALGTLAIVLFLGAHLQASATLPVAAFCFFLFFTSFGFVMGPAAVLALEGHGHIAGAAAGLQGTIQFVSGAVAVAIVGSHANGGPGFMLGVLMVSQTAALVMAVACRIHAGRRTND
ncbi:multidrug effflux MFS transporter [Novosphingobium mangrovi (ex Huang et al. 2023)]|uniref:Bcr/CflA family efflux transporter n=1 Tax=Novosphingobium mangrovi (ex Huang et al. 2023) TaxID=2976432 RepID=A0ABT2I1X3_9SPHN|nr:multidrug effflux MFS transporter [Novosphingobium mangrovi (ex Huang et al. 2023)]MCT2398800.1 multidrug effflux MFS transporter [Novosphingobium mangrovi (ex Huang et al. 2023)]